MDLNNPENLPFNFMVALRVRINVIKRQIMEAFTVEDVVEGMYLGYNFKSTDLAVESVISAVKAAKNPKSVEVIWKEAVGLNFIKRDVGHKRYDAIIRRVLYQLATIDHNNNFNVDLH